MINDKFIQLHGPFTWGEEIINQIKENYPGFQYIKNIGIQAPVAHRCNINVQMFEIGKTQILELSEVKITSLVFIQNPDLQLEEYALRKNESGEYILEEPEDTLIDCLLG